MAWRYIVVTLWGDILGSNNRADVDLSVLHWRGTIAVDCESGAVIGGSDAVEELDVVRYRMLDQGGR